MSTPFTDRSIAALKPRPKRFIVRDPKLASHYVRVAPTGGKVFVCVSTDPRDRRQVWATIGRTDIMTVAEARERARAAIKRIRDGFDPFEAPPAKAKTFEQVAEEWLVRHVRDKGLRSERKMVRLLNAHVYPAWKSRAFVSVRRTDLVDLLDEVSDGHGPHTADRTLTIISSCMNWYAKRDDSYVVPVARGMRRTSLKDNARDRALDDDEIRALWRAAEDRGLYGAAFQLLLLTGQRRDKIATLRWDDIEGDTWVIRREKREKSNAAALELPPLAIAIINRQPRLASNPFVFPDRADGHCRSWSHAKERIDAVLGDTVRPWRLHDLRRTTRTLLSRVGVRPDIAERVLGHAIQGVAGVYDRHGYFTEKRDALAKLAALISSIVDPQDNVLPLQRKGRRRQG